MSATREMAKTFTKLLASLPNWIRQLPLLRS